MWVLAAAAAKSPQSCPTLCDSIDGSPSGSPIPGILQARTLEWVAISFSNAGKWKVKVKLLSSVRLLDTPWTATHQAPPYMGFARQEYQSGVSLPSLCECWGGYNFDKEEERHSKKLLVYVNCLHIPSYPRESTCLIWLFPIFFSLRSIFLCITSSWKEWKGKENSEGGRWRGEKNSGEKIWS